MNGYDDNRVPDRGADGTATRSGRHPLSTGYLVTGLVFLGIAASWALRASDLIDDEGARWILPLVLIVAGVAGLAASVARSAMPGRRHVRDDRVPGYDESDDGDPLAEDDQGLDPLAR